MSRINNYYILGIIICHFNQRKEVNILFNLNFCFYLVNSPRKNVYLFILIQIFHYCYPALGEIDIYGFYYKFSNIIT